MKRRGIMGILLLGLLLIGATACGGGGEVTTTQPTVKSDITVTGNGNIEASSHERLTFSSSGKVDKIYVKEGDKVSKGDVIASLDTTDLELKLAQEQLSLAQKKAAVTEARLALAKASAAHDKSVYDLNYLRDITLASEDRIKVAESNLKAAELGIEAAESWLEVAGLQLNVSNQSVAYAQKQLEWARITAPFNGVAANVDANEGDIVLAGTTIIHLIDPTNMELTARVDEFDVVKVKTGQKVMISVGAMPGTKLEGRITFISPVAREPVGVVLFEDEDEEKSYEVKIDFDIPENSPIRAGMSATAEIIVE